MKKILILMILFLIPTAGMAQVQWMTISQALEAQKKTPKKILIDFYADWCEPCKEMDKKTYNHPEIAKIINENFYAVKFESDGNSTVTFLGHKFTNPEYRGKKGKSTLHQFSKYMNINMIPTMVFLDEKTTIQMIIGGLILLLGIRITFYSKTISVKKLLNKD